MKIKLILALFFALNASAQTKFTAKSDKNTIALNENVNVNFEINDIESEKFKPPLFIDFKVIDGPKMSVSSKLIDEKQIFKKIYTYTIQPKKSGELTISFASINAKGEIYKTTPLTINVLDSLLTPNKSIQKRKLENESTNPSISRSDSNQKNITTMNSTPFLFNIILILVIKLVLIFGFIYLLKFWLKKKENIAPIILYWALGLFFVFMLSSHIAEWVLMQTYYVENHLTRDADSIGSISSIIGLVFYIFIGVKYFKRKKNK